MHHRRVRHLSAALALVGVVLGTSACGGDDPEVQPGTETTDTSEENEQKREELLDEESYDEEEGLGRDVLEDDTDADAG